MEEMKQYLFDVHLKMWIPLLGSALELDTCYVEETKDVEWKDWSKEQQGTLRSQFLNLSAATIAASLLSAHLHSRSVIAGMVHGRLLTDDNLETADEKTPLVVFDIGISSGALSTVQITGKSSYRQQFKNGVKGSPHFEGYQSSFIGKLVDENFVEDYGYVLK